jgi:hypothetical protein
MTTLTFDTHALIESLIIAKKQAESIVRAIQSGREMDLSNLATKTDMAEIRMEMAQSEKRIFIALGGSVITTCTIILGFLQMMGKL